MLDHAVSAEKLEFDAGPLTNEAILAFSKATDSGHSGKFPLTFFTFYRTSEFLWIDRLKVDLRNLLHTDQEYEYIAPMKLGGHVTIQTHLAERRERKSRSGTLTVFVLESEMFCDEALCVRARSTFVVRSAAEENG